MRNEGEEQEPSPSKNTRLEVSWPCVVIGHQTGQQPNDEKEKPKGAFLYHVATEHTPLLPWTGPE